MYGGRGCEAARAARRDRHDAWRAWCCWCPRAVRTGDQADRHGTIKSRPCRVRTRANTAIVVPTCDARGARESREGFVADGRTSGRLSPPRDTGASLRPCDVWVSTSFAADRCDVRSHCSVDTRDGILLTSTCRSASRDPRRRLARVRVHPVRPDRVPSRARPGHGGAPA